MGLKPLSWYKKLATKKGRLAAGAFLVEGERAIGQVCQSDPQAVLEILTTASNYDRHTLYPVRQVTPNQLRSICTSQTPQGIAAVVRLPAATYSDQLPAAPGLKLLLLEDVQDPGNVGTLIRTAAALHFSGVILTEKCADPFGPKCVQSTAGSVLAVWLRRTASYLDDVVSLQEQGYTLAAADLEGTAEPLVLGDCQKLVLALGHEASGLSPALLNRATIRFAIPMDRTRADSLNVATCGAICMYLSSQPSRA